MVAVTVLWWGADGHCSYLRPTEGEQQTMLRSENKANRGLVSRSFLVKVID
jgi:hypothetical protein